MDTTTHGVSISADHLITSTMPLVGHIVRETMGRVPGHVDRDDLTSAGLTALVQAARAFEAGRGVPFARYAATRIRGAILDELRSIDWASRSVRRRARSIDEARNRLAADLGRVPTNEEVASLLGVDLDEVTANEDDLQRASVLSLQAGSESTLDELITSHEPDPAHEVEHKEQLTYLVEAIAELPERLRTVVQDYFLVERPMAEIAEELGVSESRVSQLRAEALVLLREAINRQLNPDLAVPHARPNGAAARRREAYFSAVAERHAASLRRPLAPVHQINASA
ncbi:FliA/WhiG family RNA polymerase sigma factor [Nocardioides sp. AE5]|uniref:sigma-70 family RNA polymerase sigma factor n=1 Tax=Nocardioides sp. AE5 TaxID=2962573 RepID=UPI0028827C98|nr:FliA/WhiG family RNA polymerase sigma factor [Nocardioides sp. AE5]MDT0200817.1 FliA/WhiG family RNA polymerase sigma factor [Nocardioides sp. AE5]